MAYPITTLNNRSTEATEIHRVYVHDMDDNEFQIPIGEASDRDIILLGIHRANEQFEFGRTCDLIISVIVGDDLHKVNVLFDRLLEPQEVLNKDTTPQGLWGWLDGLDLESGEEEVPWVDGMSYIHLSIMNQESDDILGRVTACIVPCLVHRGRLNISFAFCHGNDSFSRKRGRLVSRERMDNCEYIVTIDSGQARFDMIRLIVTDYMNAGSSLAVMKSNLTHDLPVWMKPGIPQALDPYVAAILRAVAEGSVTPKQTALARKLTSGRNTDNKKFVMHRDTV